MNKEKNNYLQNKKKKIFCLAYILFSLRILFLILIPPFIGLANNGDFQRLINACGLDYPVDVWNDAENYSNHFFGWITNDYVFTQPKDTGWHQIFEVFVNLSTLLSNKIENGYMDIRFMGVVNATIYLIAVLVLIGLIMQIKGKLSYALLIVALVVLSDSSIIQYCNSFYTEIGTVSFTLLLWEMLIIGFVYVSHEAKTHKIVFLITYSVIAVFAVMCKQQDILVTFPIIVITYFLFNRLNISRKTFACCLLTFLVIVGGAFYNNLGDDSSAASFNVINMEILPRTAHLENYLNEMELSEDEHAEIINNVGKNAFYTDYHYSKYKEHFTRKTEIKILIKEPLVFVKMMVDRAQELFKDVPYGNYLKESGAAKWEKTKENRTWYTLKSLVYYHNLFFYVAVLLVSLILMTYISKKEIIPIQKEIIGIYWLLPVSNLLRFITVLLGDSSHEDAKHFFMLNFEFDFIFICNIVLLFLIIMHQKNQIIAKSMSDCGPMGKRIRKSWRISKNE